MPASRLLLAAVLLLLPLPAAAQAGGSGWTPAQVGFRFGYNDNSDASVVGAQIRIPILPDGRIELIPGGDISFLSRLREYQGSIDAVYVSGGRRGGLYAGGGIVFRNTIYDGPERETRTGSSIVAGLTTRSRFQGIPLGVQLQARWVFLDADFNDPRVFSFGVNLPLWGWGEDD